MRCNFYCLDVVESQTLDKEEQLRALCVESVDAHVAQLWKTMTFRRHNGSIRRVVKVGTSWHCIGISTTPLIIIFALYGVNGTYALFNTDKTLYGIQLPKIDCYIHILVFKNNRI